MSLEDVEEAARAKAMTRYGGNVSTAARAPACHGLLFTGG